MLTNIMVQRVSYSYKRVFPTHLLNGRVEGGESTGLAQHQRANRSQVVLARRRRVLTSDVSDRAVDGVVSLRVHRLEEACVLLFRQDDVDLNVVPVVDCL